MKYYKKGQVVFDKLNKAYVRIVRVDSRNNDVQVDWRLDNEIASYHLYYKNIRPLFKKELCNESKS